VIHYELFFFYIAGFKPKDVVKQFGYARGTAYRFYHIYREAGKRARAVIGASHSMSPEREKKLNSLDQGAIEISCLTKREIQIVKAYRRRQQRKNV